MKELIPMFATEEHQPDIPERTLWLAVVERALKDYCFFFERWERYLHIQSYNNKKKIWKENSPEFNKKTMIEFNRLHSFIFSTEAKPYNVTYITHMLYDNDIAEKLREVATEQINHHLADQENKGKFLDIVTAIREKLNSFEKPTTKNTHKFKRFRVESL